MDIAKRLSAAIAHAGITGAELARRVSLSKAAINDILRGKSKGGQTFGVIAESLGVDPLWLRDGAGTPPSWVTPEPPRPVIVTGGQGLHVVGVVSAGDGKTNGDPYAEAREPFPIPESWDVVQVQGDSAYPVAYNGQFAIIDTARAATPETLDAATLHDLDNDMVLIQTTEDGHHRAYLKRFCTEPRSPCGYTLASINSGQKSPYLPPDIIDIITPVVGVVFEDPRLPRKKGRVRPPSDPAIQPEIDEQ